MSFASISSGCEGRSAHATARTGLRDDDAGRGPAALSLKRRKPLGRNRRPLTLGQAKDNPRVSYPTGSNEISEQPSEMASQRDM